ncbi:MAG: hypothetical protein A2W71_00115 [Candidatus Nealsonbacteria bacterium RIFCSPLOWO2_02_39_8]|uniref:Uncharacterized protein n=1 Tax=Candidatus Nealsonbacteria bacterium RIFCSPLOWO2_02_39_8 TaxID=1801674 RepID=A0A1G2EF01_9BACT|nr:MAG: hypothetical protein US88_C0016G0033 [Parcubacteria group bacterium GW2011_GWA2_38_27]OGZ24363.1 MAG: hypothetical protein A2W71_00115 [Candidatus Nealsonbacteria bacterium RIFCSPLOWO2_02_39_8]
MKTKLPKAIKKALKEGYVMSIIQFGSSLRKSIYQDIDLAIVLKNGCYDDFLEIVYGEKFQGFDISLIKEGEIHGPEKFRFGGHGAHFLSSMINGKILYGKNPFRVFKVSESQIRKSIISRLFDYIEDVRRAVFKDRINQNIKRRWPKFLRLSLYLLEANLKYPDILDWDNNQIGKYLKKYNIDLDATSKNLRNPKRLLILYETVWEKILKNEETI